MNQDASSVLGKSAVVVVVVSVVAGALDLVFAQLLHVEPLGLVSFGLFCLAYGMVITFLARQAATKQAAAVPVTNERAAEQARPMMVPEEAIHKFQASEPSTRPCHALTIDLEDYFHTEVASQGVAFTEWENQPTRIEASTHRLLDLLDQTQTHATFFVLGWVAKRYRRLIQEIHQRGHEVGCHSLDHQLVCRMSPQEFYTSTQTAKQLIESILHEPILGYRAPCFSITPGCEWAFDALARLGFAYDSSVHPVHHPLYGNPTAPRGAYAVANGGLMEFPIATWRLAGRNFPVGGGAYLRLLPYQYIHRGLTAWEQEMQSPAMVYLHPWEIDPYQPYIPLSLKSTIRQTWGTSTMEDKLRRLLGQFRFASVREVHKKLLGGKGLMIPSRPSYRHVQEVEQVAG